MPDKPGAFFYGKIFYYCPFGNRKIDLSQEYIKAVADMIAIDFLPYRETVCFCEGKVSLERETESVISMSAAADIGLAYPDRAVPSTRRGACGLFSFSCYFGFYLRALSGLVLGRQAGKSVCREKGAPGSHNENEV
ncbi:MAG: hypothetical protein NC211_02350 [Alistipes senegalensis]|nr:hypothetical protein [Oxalobacter formigenes]MCM1280666.1 hypothetical protein [Alistipes senegalensis]